MLNFFTSLSDQAKKLSNWRTAKYDRAILKLETVYERIHKKEKADMKDAFEGTRRVIQAHLFNADFYLIVLGLTIVAFSTRGFAQPGIDYGPWRPVVVGLAGVLAGAVPLYMFIVLFPLHVIYKVNLWLLTFVNIVLSATLFSLIEPIIPAFFYDDGILYFADLFWKILVFYALALGYVHLRIHRRICVRIHSNRHKKPAINQIVPVGKRGPLVALSAQDHYVEIMTENGTHLNRMTMKDAIELVPEASGMRVHRSHWVSYSAMLSLEKSAERYFIKLRNGTQLPVAKAKIPLVREALKNA